MCLAIPAKVLTVAEFTIEVDLMGNKKTVNTALVSEKLTAGDFVLVHAGYALEKIDQTTAQETLELFKEALEKE